jgi:hypothetical protein
MFKTNTQPKTITEKTSMALLKFTPETVAESDRVCTAETSMMLHRKKKARPEQPAIDRYVDDPSVDQDLPIDHHPTDWNDHHPLPQHLLVGPYN